MKKILSVVLTVVFALSCFNMALAADGVEGYSLSEDKKTLTVSDSSCMETISDFDDETKNGIEKIIVGTEIADDTEIAFEGFAGLKSIEIPEKLVEKDFKVAENVKIVVYKNGVSYGCEWRLTRLLEEKQYTLEISYLKETGIMMKYDDTSEGKAPWYNVRETITKLKINDGVTGIGAYAFYGLNRIETVELPASVTEIQKYAFAECTALNSIDIPNTIEKIGENAFSKCLNLKSIPYKEHDYKITRALVPSGDNLEDALQDKEENPISIVIVEGGAVINEDKSFSHNGEAKLVACKDQSPVIMENRTLVPVRAVSEATGATVDYVGKIGNNQELITIEKGDTRVALIVDQYQMIVNNDEKTIDVPAQYVNSRVLVPLRAAAEALGYNVFWDADIQTVFLLSKEISGKCGDNASFTFDDGTLTISGEGDIKEQKYYTDYPWNDIRENIDRVVIGENIESIGESAFAYCTSLDSLTMNSVKSIGKWAFYGCTALNNAIIPNGTETLGDYVFEGCTSLETASIPASIISVGNGIFGGCTSLKKIIYPGGAFSEYLKTAGVEVAPR